MSLLLAVLVSLAAWASPPGPGEQLTWEIHYAGVVAGQAWARSEAAEGGLERWSAGADSAPWLDSVYKVEDRLLSLASPTGGSVFYETRYREGGFKLDEQMFLDRVPFEIFRRQEKKGSWEEWWSDEPAQELVRDPIAGLVHLRRLQGEGPWTYAIFSGRKTWALTVRLEGIEHMQDTVVGPVEVRVLSLDTRHEGDVKQKGRWTVHLTDDARRLPVQTRIQTSMGAVRADLVAWTPPPAGPATAASEE